LLSLQKITERVKRKKKVWEMETVVSRLRQYQKVWRRKTKTSKLPTVEACEVEYSSTYGG